MEFKNFEIRDVLGPETIEQAQKYVGKAGYFADSLVELERVIDKKDNLLSYGKLRKTTDYNYLLGDRVVKKIEMKNNYTDVVLSI